MRVPGHTGNSTQLLTVSGAQSTDRDADTHPGTSAWRSRFQVEEADPGLSLCSLENTCLPNRGPTAEGDPAALPAQPGNAACRGTSPRASPLEHFSFRCCILGMKEERNLLFLVTLIGCVFIFPLQLSSTARLTHACTGGGLFVLSRRLGQEPHVHGE